MNNSGSDFSCLRRQFLLRSVTLLHTRLCSRPSITPAYHPGMPPAAATAAAAGLVGSAAESEPDPEQRREPWPESYRGGPAHSWGGC